MKKQEYIEKYGEEAYKRYLERQREYSKQYREQHKNEIREYYQQNKEKLKEKQKIYNRQHKNEIREYQQQYQKQYIETHKDEYNQYHKQYSRKYNQMFAFCIPEEIELIENYELAKADNFNGWCIHHRLECVETGAEVNCSREALIDLNLYYNRPASELMFLTSSEHQKLHLRNRENRIL